MARTLEKLREQYNTRASARQMGGGWMNRGAHTQKPKNMAVTIKRIFSYYQGYWGRLISVLALMLVSTVASLVGGYIMAPIIDRLTLAVAPNAEIRMSAMERTADRVITSIVGENAGAMTYIIAAVTLLGAIYLTVVLFTYLQERIMAKTTHNIIEKIRNELFEKLEYLPLRYFDSKPTGEIMSRFTNDVDNMDMMLGDTLTSVISGVVTLIGTVIFMVTTNVVLTIVIVVFIPLIMFAAGRIGKLSAKYYRGQQAALGAINGYMEETVTGAKVVKVFNHEEDCEEEFNLLNDDMRNTQFRAQFWGGITPAVMGNLSQVSYAAVVGVGGLLMVAGSLTPGGLTVFAGYSRQFSMPISRIATQMATIFSALAGAERVFDLMDTEPEEPDAEDADPMPAMKGDVVLNDVSFGYDPDKKVLKHISLYAHPGQKIAFVGSTGAGKTTVTNLLNRFYDVQEGSISIDGTDIRKIKRDVLRQNIAMVLQDTHLFTGTVRENIRYGRLDATDEEVVEAAKIASAHSFIMRLADGYDTMIEGDGTNLSQGQRQLLNIARAAISKAPILVLDEATSSVDTRTERHIEHGMDRIMRSRTTFVIAHRLSTVRNANAIMVLENGEIIERGDHDDLLEQKGRYYELYTGKSELK